MVLPIIFRFVKYNYFVVLPTKLYLRLYKTLTNNNV